MIIHGTQHIIIIIFQPQVPRRFLYEVCKKLLLGNDVIKVCVHYSDSSKRPNRVGC